MREIDFTTEELKKTIKNTYIASGSEASIYKYKKFVAIRLYDVGDGCFCPVTGKQIGKPLCKSMVEKLHLYKDNIKTTSFPIGIVKENGIVVGQLIKYYNNSQTLTDFLKNNPEQDPIKYYLKILNILEELTSHNICYEDVHGRNFLVINNHKIRLIDFSDHRIKIGEDYRERFYPMFQNFNSMVNRINFNELHLEDTYDRLIIPPEIKRDTEHLEEDFNFIRNQLKNLHKNHKEKKKL